MDRKDLLVIMPAHNEEENLPRLLDQMAAERVSQIADVLVINDASEDATASIISAHGYRMISNVFCHCY